MMLIIIICILLSSGPVDAHEQEHIVWPDKGELIQVSNAVPGTTFHRTIRISGTYSNSSSYYVRISLLKDDHELSKVLLVTLSQHGKEIYSGTLNYLTGKTHNISMKDINVTITFDRNAGNVYQKSTILFSAEIGREKTTYNKNKDIWEVCKGFIKNIVKKGEKVSVRPR